MDAKELNQIRKIIKEELKPIETRLTNLENIVSTLATREELFDLKEKSIASFKIVLERMDRLDGRLEILEDDLKMFSYRFEDIRDMVISNQITLHDHTREINRLTQEH